MLTLMMMGLSATGCLKPAELPRAEAATPVSVAAVLEYLDTDAVEPWPEEVEARVAEALSARNLPPTVLEDAAIGGWSELRGSRQRMEQIPSDDAALVLLLESHVEYYSQISGQFRWTVDVRATLAPADDLDAVQVEEFQVPVFLYYYNEREREALEAAAPNIEREVGAMVDRFLGL